MELKKLRKWLKISQEELAQKMKVKREFIARIESGEQNITIETLNRVLRRPVKNSNSTSNKYLKNIYL